MPSPPSAAESGGHAAIEKLTAEFWPGIPVIPVMSTGGDRRQLPAQRRHSDLWSLGAGGDRYDFRAHGKDERVPVKSFFDGSEYLYRLVKALASDSR